MTYLTELNRARHFAGMKPLSEEQSMKIDEIMSEAKGPSHPEAAEAGKKSRESGKDMSIFIVTANKLKKVRAALKDLKRELDRTDVSDKYGGPKQHLAGAQLKKLEALAAMEADAEDLYGWVDSYINSSR